MLSLNAAVVSLVMMPATPLVALAEEWRSAAMDGGGRESKGEERRLYSFHGILTWYQTTEYFLPAQTHT